MASTSLARAPLSSLENRKLVNGRNNDKMQLCLLLFRNSSVYAALSANLHSTYGFICVKATEVHVFLCTSLPSRALPLTMQYGTPILRHRAGRKMTSYRNKKKLIFHRDKVKEETWTLWSLLRVKKLVCFDLHRDFRWRNLNIIASYHFFFFNSTSNLKSRCRRYILRWDQHHGQWQPAAPSCFPPVLWRCSHLKVGEHAYSGVTDQIFQWL